MILDSGSKSFPSYRKRQPTRINNAAGQSSEIDSLLKIGKRLPASKLGDSEPLRLPEELRDPLTQLSRSDGVLGGLGGESNTDDSERRRKEILNWGEVGHTSACRFP